MGSNREAQAHTVGRGGEKPIKQEKECQQATWTQKEKEVWDMYMGTRLP